MSKQVLWVSSAIGSLVLLVLVAMPRYQIAASADGNAYKVDTWTGKTWICMSVFRDTDRPCLDMQDYDNDRLLDEGLAKIDQQNRVGR